MHMYMLSKKFQYQLCIFNVKDFVYFGIGFSKLSFFKNCPDGLDLIIWLYTQRYRWDHGFKLFFCTKCVETSTLKDGNSQHYLN